MTVVDTSRLLDYRAAAKRVGRDVRSIRGWRREGMPMQMIGDTMYVHEETLLEWYRERLKSSPVEYYRRRRIAREHGLPDPTPPTNPRPRASTPDTPHRPPIAVTEPESAAEADIDPLADMRPLPPEYAALKEALKRDTAGCAGLDMFTSDRIDDETVPLLEAICASCPLLDECRAFAEASRPASGFWAGRSWAAVRRTAHAASPNLRAECGG